MYQQGIDHVLNLKKMYLRGIKARIFKGFLGIPNSCLNIYIYFQRLTDYSIIIIILAHDNNWLLNMTFESRKRSWCCFSVIQANVHPSSYWPRGRCLPSLPLVIVAIAKGNWAISVYYLLHNKKKFMNIITSCDFHRVLDLVIIIKRK